MKEMTKLNLPGENLIEEQRQQAKGSRWCLTGIETRTELLAIEKGQGSVNINSRRY